MPNWIKMSPAEIRARKIAPISNALRRMVLEMKAGESLHENGVLGRD